MYGQKSISQSLLDAVNTAMFEDIHPQAQSLLKHIKPEHHSTYKPFLAKGTFNGSHKDKTDVLNAAKQAGHLVSENIEEGFKELMQDVKDRAGPQPKGHIGQKAGTRYGGAGQKDDEREKETERLDNKKKAMKKESFGDFKDRLIESLKGNQHKIDKNKNNKIDAHDFKLLRAQKEEVEQVDEANKESKKDFDARQARLAAAGKETAKNPERLKRLSSIPGYTAAMNLAKKTTKEEVEELDELSIGTLLKVKQAAVRGANAATSDGDDAKADKRYDLAGKANHKIELKHRALGLKPSGQHAMEEVKTSKGLTVDTLAGPKKAPKGFEKDNEHTSAKVPLKSEEIEHEDEKEDKALLKKMIKKSALKTEGKRPESDTVPFVTDSAQSTKERLRAAFGKVKKEMSNGY